MSFHRNQKNFMSKRFSIFIILCGLTVASIWIAERQTVLSEDTAVANDAIVVTMHVQSLFPPDEKAAIHLSSTEGLDTAYRAPVEFERLSWRGPVWKQTCYLPHTTLNAVSTQMAVIHDHLVFLPEIEESGPGQAQKPQPLHAPVETAGPNAATGPLALLAFIILTILFARKLSSLRPPNAFLRRLPATAQSLERIPELMSRKGITKKTHPEFFLELDRLRFAPAPPSQTDVRDIIRKALKL